ncbi:hypothetical protein B0H13DRAFT_1851377 [Mycena leptocephala]|nr:hypothetical protein B0H13DRAFT_1851377 [Mycena leptocephala]
MRRREAAATAAPQAVRWHEMRRGVNGRGCIRSGCGVGSQRALGRGVMRRDAEGGKWRQRRRARQCGGAKLSGVDGRGCTPICGAGMRRDAAAGCSGRSGAAGSAVASNEAGVDSCVPTRGHPRRWGAAGCGGMRVAGSGGNVGAAGSAVGQNGRAAMTMARTRAGVTYLGHPRCWRAAGCGIPVIERPVEARKQARGQEFCVI